MRDLPKPEFIKIDPARLEAELITRYEQQSGKTPVSYTHLTLPTTPYV